MKLWKRKQKQKQKLKQEELLKQMAGDAKENETPFNMLTGVTALRNEIMERLKAPYGNKANRKSDKLLLRWIDSNKRDYGYAPEPYLHAIVVTYLNRKEIRNKNGR